MTLNASGPISLGGSTVGQSINLELGVSATALASINSSSFRTLAGVASGQISLSNFYGKSNALPIAFNSAIMASNGSQDYFYTSAQQSTCVPYAGSMVFAGGSGGSVMYMSKFNGTNGSLTWSKYISPGIYINNPVSTTDSAGNSYYVTTQQGGTTLYVIKFDTNGAIIYSKRATSNISYPQRVFCDSSNNVYILGSSNISPSYSGYLYKFDSNFNFLWGVNVGSNAYYGGVFASNGDILIAGINSYFYRINSSGTSIQSYQLPYNGSYNTSDIAVASNGDIYLTGSGYVGKLSSSYVLQWVRYINVGNGYGRILATSNGCVVSGGQASNAGYQGFMTGISSSGTLQWCNSMVPPNPSYGSSMIERWGTDGSSIYFTGNVAIAPEYASGNPAYYTQNGGIAGNIPADGTGLGIYRIGNRNWFYYSAYGASLTTYTPTLYTYTAGTPSTVSSTVTTGTAYTTSDNTATNYGINGGTVSTTTGSATFTFPGTYSWICPTGVSSVSVVCVGGGGGGCGGRTSATGGGGGGGLGYRNGISVTAGSSYTVVVGSGGTGGGTPGLSGSAGSNSSFTASIGTMTGNGGNAGTNSSGGTGGSYGGVATAGNSGGNGGYSDAMGGGGGAGGYTANGGNGANINGGSGGTSSGGGGGGAGTGQSYSSGYATDSTGAGGVGLGGLGSNGVGGTPATYGGYAGSGGSRRDYGGGGSAGGFFLVCVGTCCEHWAYQTGGNGGSGGVRIVYPGTRSFPSSAGSP